MIGAIIGDIAGSRFEVRNHKSKKFEIFHEKCRPTDDSVMSLAVAKAILECEAEKDDFRDGSGSFSVSENSLSEDSPMNAGSEKRDVEISETSAGNGSDKTGKKDTRFSALSEKAVSCMQELGRIYKNAGYGGTFIKWIWSQNPQPYGSYGNGSAMRVSPCGFAARSLNEAKYLSAEVTKVTHNHPEGMKGAEAIAVAVYLARQGKSKSEIRDYIQKNYYDIDFTIDGIRRSYRFDVSCQGSVPVALEAFFESRDFEDAIRTAVSVGGDSDTIAAMAGAVAEAYYGVPEEMIAGAISYLDSREMEILYYFEKTYPSKAIGEDGEVRTVFDVLDEFVDMQVPPGTEMLTAEVALERAGYVGLTVLPGMLTGYRGEKNEKPVHVWVKKEDLMPDFSSFDRHESKA